MTSSDFMQDADYVLHTLLMFMVNGFQNGLCLTIILSDLSLAKRKLRLDSLDLLIGGAQFGSALSPTVLGFT